MPTFILASESTYKRQLLQRLGIPFQSVSASIDERVQAGELPVDLAQRLAYQKAQTVQLQYPHAFILGADQVISLDDTIFSKPGNIKAAKDQLEKLSARTHDLFTAICLLTPHGQRHDSLTHFQLTMRPLTHEAIHDYVHEDLPIDCAGSYKIESAGIRLFSSILGDDYTAIIGLPLTRVWSLLTNAGYFEN